VLYEDVRKTAEFINPDIALKGILFDEVTELNTMLTLSATQKWASLLQNTSLYNIRHLVSTLMTIPTSNAAVE
jgi:hypothetical protein